MTQTNLIRLLKKSLSPFRQELNELDWKLQLSPEKDQLKRHLSAFANLPGGGYLVFGIEDGSGNPRGVSQDSVTALVGRLSNLASDALEPRVQIEPICFELDSTPLLAIKIVESDEKPVHIRGKSVEESYVRSGGTTRKMSKADLRNAFLNSRQKRWEELPCPVKYSEESGLSELDFSEVFSRLHVPGFTSDETRNVWLLAHKLVVSEGGVLQPTNLGILSCCKNFAAAPGFERCAVRVLTIAGASKIAPAKERIFSSGYSLSIDKIVEHVVESIPHRENIKSATREDRPIIPSIVIRELIGNAIIHRDYSRTDSQILVEIYSDRIEITSPGGLLSGISVDRIIDHPPRTRNEVLADHMKQLNFYEERGSGFDKVVAALELHGLPPIEIRSSPDYFSAVIHHPKPFSELSKDERIEAAYQHACLNFVSGKKTVNSSLRMRLGLEATKTVQILRLISDAVEAGRLKPADTSLGPKFMHYLPYWA